MKKVRISKINNNDYELIDKDNNIYVKNIEFNAAYKPRINDIIYFPKTILDEINLFYFTDKMERKNIKETEIIKVVTLDKQYYYFRQYG